MLLQEKQAESIVDKLCQRFRLSEEPRQWRDIAFCLSLLPYKSERSVKKLIEGLQFYRDKLHEKEVFERFEEILTKVAHVFMEAVFHRLTYCLRLARTKRPTSRMRSSTSSSRYFWRPNSAKSNTDRRYSQILQDHKLQGEDDQALEKRAAGKKAAAKKKAARRSTCTPLCRLSVAEGRS
jgi:condensin complex subunit 1